MFFFSKGIIKFGGSMGIISYKNKSMDISKNVSIF